MVKRSWLIGGLAAAALVGGVGWTVQAKDAHDAERSACDIKQRVELDRMQAVVTRILPKATELQRLNQCRDEADAQLIAVTPLRLRGGDVDHLFKNAGWTTWVQNGSWKSVDGRMYVTRGWHGRGTNKNTERIEISMQKVGYQGPDF